MIRVAIWIGRVFLLLLAAIALAWLGNASFWSSYKAPMTIVAHRGLAQTYDREGLERDTCTATRIHRPEHAYLENTIASMEAAFAAGADIVEFDIHPTTDGQFAVVHDWRLECRTNGKGVTRDQNMVYLKTLDIGYGYTADGGKTFPFRGKFVGAMPTLDEVLTRFPDKRFLINIKSRDPDEGVMLATRLKKLPVAQQKQLMSYGGGDEPERMLARAMPGMRTMAKKQLRNCLLNFLSYGWTGITPQACRNTIILVPMNYTFLLWGWPNRFVERMRAVNTEVFVIGPYEGGDPGARGVDIQAEAKQIPTDFPGGVWTNRADKVAPILREH